MQRKLQLKQFLVLVVILLCTHNIFSQTVIFNADFNGTDGDNAWYNSADNSRGTWVPNGGGDTYLRPNRWFDYRSRVQIEIISPYVDFSDYTNLTLDLDYFFDTEPGDDGMRVEYSVNDGAWQKLGDFASGFYNSTEVEAIGTNEEGWSGENIANTNTFSQAPTLDMSAFDPLLNGASNVRFKMIFKADNGQNYDGVAFDDFIIRGDLQSGPEIEITGNTQTINSGDTTPTTGDYTNFGNIEANNSTQTYTFVIENSGSDPLLLTGATSIVDIQGTNSDQFSVGTPPAAVVAAGSSTTFTIIYTPTTVAIHNATISIVNNDATENPYTFDIIGQGTGASPEINIVSNNNDVTDGSTVTSSLNGTFFGIITEGISVTKTYYIYNEGNENLILSGASYVNISGTNNTLFTVTEPPTSPIEPGGSTFFNITYTPDAAGDHTAIVTINNNDVDESIYTFNISGESLGQRPEVEVSGSNIPINNNDTTPNSFDGTDFGNAVVNTTVSRQFRITNTGLATLSFITPAPNFLEISGVNADQFSVTVQPNNDIASSGGSEVIEISYVPTIVGVHTAQISFETNDDDEGFFIFDITGAAVATPKPEIEISGNIGVPIFNGDTSPSILDYTDYGTIYFGQSKVFTHGIRNLGTNLLALGAYPYVTITGTNADEFELIAPPPVPPATPFVPPTDIYVPYTIRYTPTTAGVHRATVTIVNNDDDESPFTYTIGGTSGENPDATHTIYFENFNASDGNWTSSKAVTATSGSEWVYGDSTEEVGSDGNSWYVTPSGGYRDDTNTFLTSPRIDLTGFKTLEYYMDIRYDTDDDGDDDGALVEYSSNNGLSWTQLGSDTSADSRQWYNQSRVSALGTSGWSGKTNAGPGALTTDSQSHRTFIKLPTALENNQFVRFRVRFASDNNRSDRGVTIDNIFIKGDPLTPFTPPTIAPGGEATNLTLWLKADDLNSGFVDGAPVSLWKDQAIDNDAKGLTSKSPTFYDNETENINFNPVIDFTRSLNTHLVGKGGYNSKEYWIVVRTDQSVNKDGLPQVLISGRKNYDQFSQDSSGLAINPFSQRFSGVNDLVSHIMGSVPKSLGTTTPESYGRAIVTDDAFSFTNDEVFLFNIKTNEANQITEIFKNGRRMDTTTGITTASNEVLPLVDQLNAQYNLGIGFLQLNGSGAETAFDGKITEVLSYSNANSLVSRIKIQTYLAIKYGITITPSEYPIYSPRFGNQFLIDTDTRILWEPTQDEAFSYDVTGIGRDDASGLDQRQSKNSNDASILTIGLTDVYGTNNENKASNPESFQDKDFLMWGNNGEPLEAATPIFVDLSNGITGVETIVNFLSIKRFWKVKEFGDVKTVKVKIPEISLSATITPPGDYLMFVSDTPNFSPTSEYTVMKTNGDDLETEYDFDGTKYITFGFAPDYIYERSIDFDGVQDYMDAGDNIDLNSEFTISAWVKRGANSGNKDILSKRNSGSYTDGYTLRFSAGGVPLMLWRTGSGTVRRIDASTVVPQNEWHHIAVIYSGGTGTIYIDGVADGTANVVAPTANNERFLIGAANYRSPSHLFDGTIDEVQVWNTALSLDQLRYTMNQELTKFTDGSTQGKTLPITISKNEIETIPWSELEAYFQMNKYTFTNIKDDSNNGHIAAIKNLDTVDEQTAPLPYKSVNDGDFDNNSTWENGSLIQVPGGNSIVNGSKIEWNIAEISHNVNTDDNNILLGLTVNNNEFSIKDDKMLKVTHYLKLNGTIDLEGESQLIQTEESDLDVLSTGFIEKDQQGTADTFSYNIWASPVGAINGTQNNRPSNVSSFLMDGTTTTAPAPITFAAGYDGAPTTPITLSSFWLYTFINSSDDYANWVQIGSGADVAPGIGYTMKGPGTGSIITDQNYTFIGKPNNSTTSASIKHYIDANNTSMVGNPFPSALDAYDFIDENPHLTGTLYFWEHWGGGDHILRNYQAGYAMLTKLDAIPAASHSANTHTGNGNKTPERYIPAGQGFFVEALTSGDIVFNNSQRDFELESGSSIFMIAEGGTTNEDTRSSETNSDNVNTATASYQDGEDLRAKLRIGFDSSSGVHRQILLGQDESTTFGDDPGYDGILLDENTEDMTWYFNDEKYGIQAVPAFEVNRTFPLRVVMAVDGTIKIGIDAVSHFDLETTNVYVYDARFETYTKINENPYEVSVIADTYNDRFAIVFRTTQTTEETDETVEDNQEVIVVESDSIENVVEIDGTSVRYDFEEKLITILKEEQTIIESVELFNILGQVVSEWTPDHNTTQIVLPVPASLSAGVYVVQVHSAFRTTTQKIIIK